jgi:hypothetical protein
MSRKYQFNIINLKIYFCRDTNPLKGLSYKIDFENVDEK